MVASIIKLIVAMTVTLHSGIGLSQRFNTAEGSLPAPTKEEIERGKRVAGIAPSEILSKDWEVLLNPAYEEFWKEGNHKPDDGFVLFARNPTKQNAKNWLLRMETKAKVVSHMYSLVEEAQHELIKSGQMVDRYNVASMAGTASGASDQKLLKAAIPKDVTIYFLFGSWCPVCKRMAKTLAPLKDQVEPLQIPLPLSLQSASKDQLLHFEGLKESRWVDNGTRQKYVGTKVPVILVFSKKTNQVARVESALTIQELVKVAADVSTEQKR